MLFLWAIKDPLCNIFPQNGKPVSVMVFIIFRGKSSVAIYNTIICLLYIHYRHYKKADSNKLIISYLICYFCHIQICNDDCWVICILFANVKSLFDHVTRRYDIASLGAESESQDLQAD